MKRRTIKTKTFNSPVSEANRVIREINQLVRKMSSDYRLHSVIFDADLLDRLRLKYEQLFEHRSLGWSYRISDSALKSADTQFIQSLKDISADVSIGQLNLTDSMRNTFDIVTKDNAELFKTIPAKFHSQVSSTVFNAITHGKGAYDITRYIKKFDNGTRNYVQLRTMDQTRKAFSALSRERMVSAGIKKFKWNHVGGTEHPRKLHQSLNGKVFDIDNPPYIGTMYGADVYGYPSQLPNCRCRQAFVFADI